MRLIWSRAAADDRLRVLDRIAERNPSAALSMDDRIEAVAERLAAHPESGRMGRVPGTREAVVPGTPFLIVYRSLAGEVRMLRVLHGAQRWPQADP